MSDFVVSDVAVEERTDVLSNLPAGRRQRRFARAIMAASTVVFLILVPFAKVALQPVPAFIPIYQSALLVNDLITAVFLLGQRQLSRSHGLSLLAGAYLFTALMSTVHALSFPGRVSRQTAARCRAVDHGLALHVLARRVPAFRHRLYAIRAERTAGRRRQRYDCEHRRLGHLWFAVLGYWRPVGQVCCLRSCRTIITRRP